MEPLTKEDFFSGITILFISMLFVMALVSLNEYRCHEREMEEIHSNTLLLQEINSKIDKRESLDEAYRIHLGQCAFINRENITIDKRGYVKSKYKPDGLSEAL